MSGEVDLDRIREHFRFFAANLPELPLYRRLSLGIAEDPEVAALLLSAEPGQARPVLLLAAVHLLVLQQPDVALGRWYGSVTAAEELSSDDPYPAFRALCLENASELREIIATHRTQTNEVNRVALLAPMFATCTGDLAEQPLSVVELGSSAGLLLGLERYRCDIAGAVSGDPTSPVRLGATLRGTSVPPRWAHPPVPAVAERVGIDQAPIALTDRQAVRWLEACLWPDQPWRIDRFRAAVDLLAPDPPRLVAGDFIDTLPEVVATLRPDTHLVVFHGWALTYVERSRRPELAEILGRVAAEGRPVSWLSAEAPRCVPEIVPPVPPVDGEAVTPETVLGLRAWRDGRELAPRALGWGHAHGSWLSWVG